MATENPEPTPAGATLYGGPADGLAIPPGGDVEWVAVKVDDNGTPIPVQAGPGVAVVLPDTQGPETERLMNETSRWECYRRIGAHPPGMDTDPRDDLPIPGTGGVAYRWVCSKKGAM